MCEMTYLGCPQCDAVYEDIRYSVQASILMEFPIDEDGEPIMDQPTFTSDPETDGQDSEFLCVCCGTAIRDMDELREVVPEDCTCAECQKEAEASPNEQPAGYGSLVRPREVSLSFMGEQLAKLGDDIPVEMLTLCERRSIAVLPVSHTRLNELRTWGHRNELIDGELFVTKHAPPPKHFLGLEQLQISRPVQSQD